MNTVGFPLAHSVRKTANKCLGQISIVRHTPSFTGQAPKQCNTPRSTTTVHTQRVTELPSPSPTKHPKNITPPTPKLTPQQLRLGNPHRRRRRRLLLRQTQHQRRPRRKSRSRPPKAHPPLPARARAPEQPVPILLANLTTAVCQRDGAALNAQRRGLGHCWEPRTRGRRGRERESEYAG